jgi:photosystem II stability/assembly factor-like uncharacterized protein
MNATKNTPARCLRILCVFALLSASACLCLFAQSTPPEYFKNLRWRMIGPFRAGRVVAVAGVPGNSTDFYFGAVDGGVWSTSNAGTVWKPIMDGQPVGSIGALAIAPSNAKVIYAGTGESDIRSDLASGNGVYKSTDGGASWKNIGLRDSRQISRILIDPNDADVVYVGVLGHAYGPSEERGVYKSVDGGATWKRVLDKGPEVGISDMAMATGNSRVLFAGTWNAHRPTWSTYAPLEGPGNGLYRSTDGGATWSQLSGHGLPEGAWGRAGVAVSPDGRRVYAVISVQAVISEQKDEKKQSGLYRSDDGGDTWTFANADPRLTSRGWYFNCITIDPGNPDVLYIPNVALYRTEDGGKTISIVRGAPGGDDYHQIWVDPKDSAHLLLGVDQGATISLDRGKTWTTWYNQPTAQLYHVTTDHHFPYTVYGAQQDSGAVAVASRTDHGEIDARDWSQPGGSESGYIAIDPRDEDILYLSGAYGDVQRFDRRTSFSQNVTPWPLGGFALEIAKRKYRDPWTPVLVFSPADTRSLYLGTQYVMKTVDGGLHWQQISPDLTGADLGAGAHATTTGATTAENAKQRGYGVVYTLAPSPLNAPEIWAGSDTGLIHLTIDGGKTWSDVTPQGLPTWSKITLIEASHYDPAVAYAAVDRHRLDDDKPYLYVTRDYGKSWRLSVDGLDASSFLNVVREDAKQRGLLYAGTEFGMYASFDDGNHWQPLQMNLPATSVRDIDVHGDDLVIATHGRSFWILDDIAPLRQTVEARKAAAAWFYAPAEAVRVDNDSFLGTPLPPEEPQAKNPPSGAIFDYLLKSPAHSVTLQIYDQHHQLVRHFSSADTSADRSREKQEHHHAALPIAERWFPAPQTLDTTAGAHRFVWNLASGGSEAGADDDDADEGAGAPSGPRVAPGVYTVQLTVDGESMQQTLRVAMDSRVQAIPAELQQQFELGQKIYAEALRSRKAMAEIQSVQEELKKLKSSVAQDAKLAPEVERAQASIAQIVGADDEQKGTAREEEQPGLSQASAGLGTVLRVVKSGHRSAPASALEIEKQMNALANERIAQWSGFKSTQLAQLNAELHQANLKPVQITEIEREVEYLMTR